MLPLQSAGPEVLEEEPDLELARRDGGDADVGFGAAAREGRHAAVALREFLLALAATVLLLAWASLQVASRSAGRLAGAAAGRGAAVLARWGVKIVYIEDARDLEAGGGAGGQAALMDVEMGAAQRTFAASSAEERCHLQDMTKEAAEETEPAAAAGDAARTPHELPDEDGAPLRGPSEEETGRPAASAASAEVCEAPRPLQQAAEEDKSLLPSPAEKMEEEEEAKEQEPAAAAPAEACEAQSPPQEPAGEALLAAAAPAPAAPGAGELQDECLLQGPAKKEEEPVAAASAEAGEPSRLLRKPDAEEVPSAATLAAKLSVAGNVKDAGLVGNEVPGTRANPEVGTAKAGVGAPKVDKVTQSIPQHNLLQIPTPARRQRPSPPTSSRELAAAGHAGAPAMSALAELRTSGGRVAARLVSPRDVPGGNIADAGRLADAGRTTEQPRRERAATPPPPENGPIWIALTPSAEDDDCPSELGEVGEQSCFWDWRPGEQREPCASPPPGRQLGARAEQPAGSPGSPPLNAAARAGRRQRAALSRTFSERVLPTMPMPPARGQRGLRAAGSTAPSEASVGGRSSRRSSMGSVAAGKGKAVSERPRWR